MNKALGELAKRNLVARVQNAKCKYQPKLSDLGLGLNRIDDGYRLTYGGLDWLALRAFTKRKPSTVASVGTRIGVGKEADVYIVADDNRENRILKLQRCAGWQRESSPRLMRQTGAYILPSYQDQAGLPWQAQIGIMDVHVSSGCSEGVCVHEGAVRERLPRTSPHRSSPTLHRHVLDRLLSAVSSSPVQFRPTSSRLTDVKWNRWTRRPTCTLH